MLPRDPTNFSSIGRGRAGRTILIVLIVLVVALVSMLFFLFTPSNYGNPGLRDGQYYERDKTIIEQQDSTGVHF